MKAAWRRPGKRQFEEIEIIDIRPPEDLEEAWDAFIVGSHCRIYNSFSQSILARWPRRSCEAIYNQFMALRLYAENPAPAGPTLTDVQDWYRELIDPEN